MLLNCDVGEDSWESLGLQGDQISQSKRKLTLNIHWKDWRWSQGCDTLATWGKEPTHWKRPRMLGKIEGRRRKGWQRMRWMDGIMDSVDMNLSKLQKIVKDSEACAAVHWVAKSQTSLSNWTTATMVNEDGKADGPREMCKRGCKAWRLKSWREYSQWSSCRSKRLRKSPPRH